MYYRFLLFFYFFALFSTGYSSGDYEDPEDFYEETCEGCAPEINLISYGGITIECDAGCGQDDDPDLEKISKIVSKITRKISKGAFPLWIGSHLLRGFEAWEQVGEFECEAFDWLQTGGFLIEDLPFKTYRFKSYEEFLNLVAGLHNVRRLGE